jgi:hypothetical protein
MTNEVRSRRSAACVALQGKAAIDLYCSTLDRNVQAICTQAERLDREIAGLHRLLQEVQSIAPAKNPTDRR